MLGSACSGLLTLTLLGALAFPALAFPEAAAPVAAVAPAAAAYSASELDVLFKPVALYPDPLLAQLLPASAFPAQIQAAHQWLQANPGRPARGAAATWPTSFGPAFPSRRSAAAGYFLPGW